MKDLLEFLVQHGDQLSSTIISFLGIVALVYGLVTGTIEIGPSVKERKTALKEANEALKKANDELHHIERAYDRLEWESETWNRKPRTSTPRRVVKRKTQ